MQESILELLACPTCLEPLEFKKSAPLGKKTPRGQLRCRQCARRYLVNGNVPVFGISASHYHDRLNEIHGERKWTFKANSVQEHIKFAKNSARVGEEIIHELLQRAKSDRVLRVLDVGSGWGCFQSWQFATHNFDVASVELCPEFVFSSDVVACDVGFLRSVSDCSILPFRDGIFDIVFCKELLHHLGDAQTLIEEMWRVCAPDGLIAIKEPSTPITRNKRRVVLGDRAAKLGITHHSYTYEDYLRYIKPITTSLEMNGEIHTIDSMTHRLLHEIQKPLIRVFAVAQRRNCPPTIRNAALKLALTFVGGSILFVGRKNSDHGRKAHDRQVIPMTQELFDSKMEKRSRKLVNRVFPVYRQARKACGWPANRWLSKQTQSAWTSEEVDATLSEIHRPPLAKKLT